MFLAAPGRRGALRLAESLRVLRNLTTLQTLGIYKYPANGKPMVSVAERHAAMPGTLIGACAKLLENKGKRMFSRRRRYVA